MGSKVKSIGLLGDGADGEDMDCKIEGIGGMKVRVGNGDVEVGGGGDVVTEG